MVRRRKWLIALALVLVPLSAFAFSLHQATMYTGSAEVLLSTQDLGNQLTGAQDTSVYTPADRRAQTQADLARVPTVAANAVRAARADISAGTLLASSSVSVGANADILTFSVTNHDPRLAARLTTAYAESYVGYRLAVDTAPIYAALKAVNAQIARTPQSGPLFNSLEDKATQLTTLAALKSANASVVRRASDAAQTAPRTKRNVALGILLGLFLGVGLAFLRESLDTRVRSEETIGEQLRLPLLARLPPPNKKLRAENRLAMLSEPASLQAEAFRMLRTNVQFASLGKAAKVIMITSATEQEGKSTTIANLAVAMARTGQHVVLVDLDLRRPFINRFFGLEGAVGLTQVAIGQVSLAQAIVRVPVEGRDHVPLMSTAPSGYGDRHADPENGNGKVPGGILDVLPSGPIPPDPGEFVGTERLAEFLAYLRNHSDVVLIDAPPLFHVGDGLVLSSKVDAVVVVTRMDKLRRPMLAELKRQLDLMPSNKLGFIVTGTDAEIDYGSNYAGYYYAQTAQPQTVSEVSA